MSVAAYVRVSSASQSHAMQREAIERAAAARGDVVQLYTETASGGTMFRPTLDLLRQDIRAGEIRKLYVYRLDRLTRTGIRDTLALVEELREHGCTLVTLADGFDVQGPAGEIVLAVLAWAAKMERLAINERLASARERARASGKRWGRPPRMTAAEVARARAMQATGKSLRELARALKIPRPTLTRALARKSPPGEDVKPGRKRGG